VEAFVDDSGLDPSDYKNDIPMRKTNLENRLIDFASAIMEISETLPKSYVNNHLCKQLIRSATSSALNYGEAQAGESRKDFIHEVIKTFFNSKKKLRYL
jgi:hypothetical protein